MKFPEQSDYVKLVRQAAMNLSIMLPATDNATYRVAANLLKLTLPRHVNVPDESCRQAALKLVAEAFVEEADPVAQDALVEMRDIISFGAHSTNGGQFSDDMLLRLRQSRKS